MFSTKTKSRFNKNHSTITLDGARGTKLTGLKPGLINQYSQDAVIGHQLYQTNENIKGFANDIKTNSENISRLVNAVTQSLNSASLISSAKADIDLANLNETGRDVIASVATGVVEEYLRNNNNNSTGTSGLMMSAPRSFGLMASPVNNDIIVTNNDDIPSGNTDIISPAVQDALDTKAEITEVEAKFTDFNTKLADKADISYVDEGLAKKADKTELDKKADVSYVDDSLALKADKTDLDKKVNLDASNVDVAAWTDKLATGQVQEGNTGLVKGGDVYAAIMLNRNDTIGYDDSANSLRIGGSQRYDGVDVVDISKSDGSARVMTGVATNPKDPTSVANVGYVNAVNDMVIQSVNGSLEKVNTRLNKVGANAAAMSALTPASFEGDERWSLAASVGNYRSETAGAVGAFYKPAENVMMNLRGSFGSDENMVAAGVAVSLSKGDVPGVTKRQLVNTVNAQSQKLENYEHRISELEALVRTLYDRLPAEKK